MLIAGEHSLYPTTITRRVSGNDNGTVKTVPYILKKKMRTVFQTVLLYTAQPWVARRCMEVQEEILLPGFGAAPRRFPPASAQVRGSAPTYPPPCPSTAGGWYV